MNNNGLITPQDIVARLLCRHPCWFHGEPTIHLSGEEGSFGKLKFDFGDEIVEYNIYIDNRKGTLDAAHTAVKNFKEMSQKHYELQ